MTRILWLAAIVLLMSACGSKEPRDLLTGTWKEINTGKSEFRYNSDGTYLYKFFDGTQEEGKWRVEGDTLYTLEKGTEEELSEQFTVDEEKLVLTTAEMFQTEFRRAK